MAKNDKLEKRLRLAGLALLGLLDDVDPTAVEFQRPPQLQTRARKPKAGKPWYPEDIQTREQG